MGFQQKAEGWIELTQVAGVGESEGIEYYKHGACLRAKK